MSNHFLAIDLSDEERHRLAAVLRETGAADAVPGRRVPVDNWHITARFLGIATEIQTERLLSGLEDALTMSSGRIWLDGIGAFPKTSKANVVFCSVDDPEEMLPVIAALCDEAAVDVGFEPEDRPFLPHLTIARLRPPADVRRTVANIEPFRVPVDVLSVTLMRTRSVRHGVAYDRLERIDLYVGSRDVRGS